MFVPGGTSIVALEYALQSLISSFLGKIYHPIVNGGANFTHFEHANYFFSSNKPKPSLKIRTANAIFWISLGIFRDYGLKNIFFRNKNFLFLKIKKSWKIQDLFEMEFRETSQNFNWIRQWIEKMKITIVWISWMSWNFARFYEILFQTDAESFSFLSWKTKKFYS